MPKPEDDRSRPEPLPVRPPTLPPDFPDGPANPSSELQPPPSDPRPICGRDACSDSTRNIATQQARLRDRIEQVLEKHPELRDLTEEIALRQDMHVQVGKGARPPSRRLDAALFDTMKARSVSTNRSSTMAAPKNSGITHDSLVSRGSGVKGPRPIGD